MTRNAWRNAHRIADDHARHIREIETQAFLRIAAISALKGAPFPAIPQAKETFHHGA
jgi:hypothetical protein